MGIVSIDPASRWHCWSGALYSVDPFWYNMSRSLQLSYPEASVKIWATFWSYNIEQMLFRFSANRVWSELRWWFEGMKWRTPRSGVLPARSCLPMPFPALLKMPPSFLSSLPSCLAGPCLNLYIGQQPNNPWYVHLHVRHMPCALPIVMGKQSANGRPGWFALCFAHHRGPGDNPSIRTPPIPTSQPSPLPAPLPPSGFPLASLWPPWIAKGRLNWGQDYLEWIEAKIIWSELGLKLFGVSWRGAGILFRG